jgi:EAL domain-containing protein (putative c-di-GMP-specific phosphodiesterase class I)
VENDEGARTLEAWGCDYLQGALIGLASTERPWITGLARAI